MSRRGRAIAFLALALAAATLSAALVRGYGSSVARGYGPLRPVVIVRAAVLPRRPLGAKEVSDALEVRRVPVRFVPPGALADPREALGLVSRLALPAGSYLVAASLRAPGHGRQSGHLGEGRRPVQISVSGAEALLAAGTALSGARVDVVVTTEPSGPGAGQTYVAAAGVPLLALRPGIEGAGAEGLSAATLGLRKGQALRLIEAESFARKLTLLPTG